MMTDPAPLTNTATPLHPNIPLPESGPADGGLEGVPLAAEDLVAGRLHSASMGQAPLQPLLPPRPAATAKRPASASASGETKTCNCRNSKCLKLYCECFASGRYCNNCNCANCMNNTANEGARSRAIENILERNPNAFRPKIQFQPVRRFQRNDFVAATHNASALLMRLLACRVRMVVLGLGSPDTARAALVGSLTV